MATDSYEVSEVSPSLQGLHFHPPPSTEHLRLLTHLPFQCARRAASAMAAHQSLLPHKRARHAASKPRQGAIWHCAHGQPILRACSEGTGADAAGDAEAVRADTSGGSPHRLRRHLAQEHQVRHALRGEQQGDLSTILSSNSSLALPQLYIHISDKLLGTLLCARRHKYIDFQGETLFQGRDDDEPVRLIRPYRELRLEILEKIKKLKNTVIQRPQEKRPVHAS